MKLAAFAIGLILSISPAFADPWRLQVTSEPPGASVLVNGAVACAAPCTIEFPREGQTRINFAMEGYRLVEQPAMHPMWVYRRGFLGITQSVQEWAPITARFEPEGAAHE